MLFAGLLLTLAALVALDPSGYDSAVVKLPVLVLGAALLLAVTALRKRPVPASRLDAVVGLLLFWSVLADGMAPYPSRGDAGLLLALLGAAGYFLARRELTPETAVRGFAWVAGLAAASQLIEGVASPPWQSAPGRPAYELVGLLANPNLTASAVLLGAPSLIALAGGWGALLVAGALLGSLSRGALIGAFVGTVAWRVLRGGTLDRRLVAAVLAGAGLALASGRLYPAQVTESRTIQSRLDLARVYSKACRDRPLFGWGAGGGGVAFSLTTARDGRPETLSDLESRAHNPLLQRATEAGVPAAVLALALVVLAVGPAWAAAAASPEGAQLVCGLLAMSVAEAVSVGWETPVLRWLAFVALGSLPQPEGPPSRSPLAAGLALSLFAGVPLALGLTQAERLRRLARGATPDGAARSVALEAPDLYPEPKLRFDAAAQLVLERRIAGARARFLVLESRAPEFGSSREYRKSLRELSEGASR